MTSIIYFCLMINKVKERERKHIVMTIQELFDPDSDAEAFWFRKSVREKVEKDDKGYIAYHHILEHQKVKRCLEMYSLMEEYRRNKQQFYEFLMNCIKATSKILWANPCGVRPLNPNIDEKLSILYFTGFDKTNKCENFKALLRERAEIAEIKFYQNSEYAMVVSHNRAELMELDGYEWGEDADSALTVKQEEDIKRDISSQQYEQLYKTEVGNRHPCIVSKIGHRITKIGTVVPRAYPEEKPVNFKHQNRQYSSLKQEDSKMIVQFNRLKELREDPFDYSDYEQKQV